MIRQFNTLWGSMEFIALLKKCSCSRLAIQGGLDATTFNKSKRRTKYGQPHWMSVGTLISTLEGAQMTILDFAVIYQMLYMVQPKIEPDQMRDIMLEIRTNLQTHIDRLNAAGMAGSTTGQGTITPGEGF